MFEFSWLWAWLLLPLPFLVYRFSKPAVQPVAIRLPKLPEGIGQQQPDTRWRKVIMVLAWCCLLGALARPVWYGDPVEINPEHRGHAASCRSIRINVDRRHGDIQWR